MIAKIVKRKSLQSNFSHLISYILREHTSNKKADKDFYSLKHKR